MTGSDYFRYWGKARPEEKGQVAFHLLPYHCLDVAAVGHEYLRRAPSLRTLFGRALNVEGEQTLLNWLAFWLALHDLGKFAESFQGQKPELFRELRGREASPRKPYRIRHDSLGMLLWRDVLSERAIEESWFGEATELALDGLDFWIRAVAGHHGQPPEHMAGEFWELHFDSREDRKAVVMFVSDLRALLLNDSAVHVPAALDAETFHRASLELSWWVTGLAVLADWLGSNADHFRYRSDAARYPTLADYWLYARERATEALEAAGVLPMSGKRALSFGELFPFIPVPSPLQKWAASVALHPGPQIYLLEDVTGAGKTEAAVTLAHRLMASGCAEGFFIGLPTMATANAMYGRIAEVYGKMFEGNASLALAHGQRNLVEAFANSVIPPGPAEGDAQQADESATARCAAWLADHNKRALLAPAGVGTLDQALLAVLHSKHQSLRLLGLFRKVLVVDEVHACDEYMQGVLETLLEFHARAGGSAILLSATLPGRTKQALLEAFARGCRLAAPRITATSYPLVTAWHSSQPDQLCESPLATRPDISRTLAVRYVAEETEVVAGIEAALAEGKCACWMRNTIADALAAYHAFQGRLPSDKLILFHARFALRDRLRIEAEVLDHFGNGSTPELRRGRLVIATQVAEQSLDVDWDFVVSDLAPVDRLIQRAGRLQRHARTADGRRVYKPQERDARGTPCLWVFGPPWSDEPGPRWLKEFFPKAAAVYPNHSRLWLTAKSLRDEVIAMPGDGRRLIEQVFGDAEIPKGLQANADAAEGKGYADASAAQQNTVKLATGYVRGGIDWWSEAKTPSRLGEASVSVLLGRWDGDVLKPWADGEHGWAYSSVRVPERLIARTAEPASAQRKAAYDAVLETLPNKGKWCVVLALEETCSGWVGPAWAPPRKDLSERLLQWSYSEHMGLQQTDERNEEEEQE